MTARDRLVDLRRSIALTLVARALMVGIAEALVALAIGRLAGWGAWSVVLALVVLAGVASFRITALRRLRSLPRVALWVEERTPSLRYALVTVADGVTSPALEAQALGTPWWTDSRRTLLK